MSVILPSEFWLFRLYSNLPDAISSFLDTVSFTIDSCIVKWTIVANSIFNVQTEKSTESNKEIIKNNFQNHHFSSANAPQIQVASCKWMENFISNSMSMVNKDVFNNELLSELFATIPWDTLLSTVNENKSYKWNTIVWSINEETAIKIYESEPMELDSSVSTTLVKFELQNVNDPDTKIYQFKTDNFYHVVFSSSFFPFPVTFHFFAAEDSQVLNNFGNFSHNFKEGSDLHNSFLHLMNTLYPMVSVFLQSLICATLQVKSKQSKTMYTVYYADSLYKRTVLFQQISLILPTLFHSVALPKSLPYSSILEKYNSYVPILNLIIHSYCKPSGFRFWVINFHELIDSENSLNIIEFKDSLLSEVYSSVDTDLYPSLQFGFFLDNAKTYSANNFYTSGSVLVLPVWTKFDTYDTLFGIIEIFEPNLPHNKNHSMALRPLVGLENGIYY